MQASGGTALLSSSWQITAARKDGPLKNIFRLTSASGDCFTLQTCDLRGGIMLKREANHELVQAVNIDMNNCVMLMQKKKFQTHHVY